MSILPLIDALILLGWSCLLGGFLLKAIHETTAYRPVLFGLHPGELGFIAMLCLLFALALAARTWVKGAEPEIQARRRRARALETAAAQAEAYEEDRLGARPQDANATEPYRRRAAGL